MAKVVSTYTNDAGHEIAVYESGAEYDTTAKQLAKGPESTRITAANSTAYIRKRQEKQARLLRAAIVTETMDKLDVPYHGPAAAVAAAGGILWREIVLSPDAYPRDRMDAWEKLGKHAQVLDDPRRGAETVNNTMNVIALPEDVARAIADLRRLMVERAEAVDSE